MELLCNEPRFVRPLNVPPETAGQGSVVIQKGSLPPVAVLNLQSHTFRPVLDKPFLLGRLEVERPRQQTRVVFVDTHAEATSPWKPAAREGISLPVRAGSVRTLPAPGLAE